MKKGLLAIFSISLLLIVWQLLAMLINLPDLFPSVPRLIQILCGLVRSEQFYLSVAATLVRGISGMLLSLIAASGVAWLFSRNELVYELFRPLLAIMRSVPVISFILLALIFLNAESIPLIIGFLTMFPLLVENLTNGIRSQRKELKTMAHQFRIGIWNTLTQIFYPQLKPFLYSGLASALGFGWRAIIMGEVLAQCSVGIGGEMKRAQTFIAVPELMAWTIIAISISFLFDKGISWLSKQSFPIMYNKRKNLTNDSTGKEIQLTDLSYRIGSKVIFFHFNHLFKKGAIYGITAPSGYGKTTLLNLIGGILKPDQGEVRTEYTGGIATVFQKPELLNHLTILDNVSLPLASATNRDFAYRQANIILRHMELDELGNLYPQELSFGQQQRVAIARALAYPSPILLMDEPFKGLDEALMFRITDNIRQRQSENGQTILFTTHNPEELKRMADEIIPIDKN